MSRYFFHIRDNGATIADEEGLELENAELAHAEVVRSARALRADAQLDGNNIDHQKIELTDSDGQLLVSFAIGELF